MIIRNITEEDLPAIIEFIKQFEGQLALERESIYWSMWRFFRDTCFLALENDKPVGILLGFMEQMEGKMGYVHELGVLPEFRQQGIATTLLKHFESVVQAKGGNRVCLSTVEENTHAMQFYEKRGFTEKTAITKVGHPRVWFCKRLG